MNICNIRKEYRCSVALLLLVITSFFVNLGALPSDIMEECNLVTAREMADDGHWLVPTMNGELRLDKPPLPTWVAGVVEIVAPGHIAVQRAMAGVSKYHLRNRLVGPFMDCLAYRWLRSRYMRYHIDKSCL